ncbi:MAG: hypothetical protein IKQ41_06480 [Clostridia bacterium]|nr:hypothetical protein [Clostridia bacterium]
MKKLSAILMALVLMLSTIPALATELNWSDYEAGVAQIEANTVTFDQISIQMWMPAVMQPVELADEDKEAGFIGYFLSPDEACYVTVQYVDVGGMSLEEYAEYVPQIGGSGAQMMVINGIPCLNYDLEEEAATAVAYATEMGYILQFTFGPYTDENYASTMQVMVASIRPVE